eukprot:11173700-Lingulodinium_polyedra.AAC.1
MENVEQRAPRNSASTRCDPVPVRSPRPLRGEVVAGAPTRLRAVDDVHVAAFPTRGTESRRQTV